MGLPALTSTKYVIREMDKFENNNKRHSIGLGVFYY